VTDVDISVYDKKHT